MAGETREMEVTIEATGLERGFGSGRLRTRAVRNLSLELHAGQVTLLMGPSGCGKSTLMAILSGLLEPEAGSVRALDRDLWSLGERQREEFRLRHCGFIFQQYNLFPTLTASQQCEIILEWGTGTRPAMSRAQAAAVLAELGLADKTHLFPDQLSGGEKQRVAVARALVKRPHLVFADEPTAALDWEHGQQVVEMLARVAHEHNATVLLVTHDPRIVPFADRVLHLLDGQFTEPSAPAPGSQPRGPNA